MGSRKDNLDPAVSSVNEKGITIKSFKTLFNNIFSDGWKEENRETFYKAGCSDPNALIKNYFQLQIDDFNLSPDKYKGMGNGALKRKFKKGFEDWINEKIKQQESVPNKEVIYKINKFLGEYLYKKKGFSFSLADKEKLESLTGGVADGLAKKNQEKKDQGKSEDISGDEIKKIIANNIFRSSILGAILEEKKNEFLEDIKKKKEELDGESKGHNISFEQYELDIKLFFPGIELGDASESIINEFNKSIASAVKKANSELEEARKQKSQQQVSSGNDVETQPSNSNKQKSSSVEQQVVSDEERKQIIIKSIIDEAVKYFEIVVGGGSSKNFAGWSVVDFVAGKIKEAKELYPDIFNESDGELEEKIILAAQEEVGKSKESTNEQKSSEKAPENQQNQGVGQTIDPADESVAGGQAEVENNSFDFKHFFGLDDIEAENYLRENVSKVEHGDFEKIFNWVLKKEIAKQDQFLDILVTGRSFDHSITQMLIDSGRAEYVAINAVHNFEFDGVNINTLLANCYLSDEWKEIKVAILRAYWKFGKSEKEIMEIFEEFDNRRSNLESSGRNKIDEELQERIDEIDGQIQESMDRVGVARGAYATKHYDVRSIFHRLRNFFGAAVKTEVDEISDVKGLFERYKSEMQTLLDLRIEKIGVLNLSEEDKAKQVGELIEYFKLEEKVNLYDAHTSARVKRVEEKFGKAPAWIEEKATNIINWYRRVDWKKKMALSLALAAGSGVSFGVAAAGKLGVRVLSAASAGVAVSAGIEALQRRKDKKVVEKTKKELLGEESIDIEKIKSFLEDDIFEYDKLIGVEKRRNLFRKSAGFLTAFALGSYAVHAFDEHSDTGVTSDHKPPQAGIDTSKPPQAETDTSKPAQSDTNPHSESGVPINKEKFVETVTSDRGGNSVWRLLEKQAEKSLGEKFTQMNPEQQVYFIDYMKDKVVENPSAFGISSGDANLVQVGEKLNFAGIFGDKETIQSALNQATQFDGEEMVSVAKGVDIPSGGDVILDSTYRASMAGVAAAATTRVGLRDTHIINQGRVDLAGGGEKNDSDFVFDMNKNRIDQELAQKRIKIAEIWDKNKEFDSNSDGVIGTEEVVENPNAQEILKNEKDRVKYLKQMDELLNGAESLKKSVAAIRKKISLGKIENWKLIKDLSYGETISGKNKEGENVEIPFEIKKALSGFGNNLKKINKALNPKENEPIEAWTRRVGSEMYDSVTSEEEISLKIAA